MKLMPLSFFSIADRQEGKPLFRRVLKHFLSVAKRSDFFRNLLCLSVRPFLSSFRMKVFFLVVIDCAPLGSYFN